MLCAVLHSLKDFPSHALPLWFLQEHLMDDCVEQFFQTEVTTCTGFPTSTFALFFKENSAARLSLTKGRPFLVFPWYLPISLSYVRTEFTSPPSFKLTNFLNTK